MSRLVLIFSISFVSVVRLHAHAIVEPAAVTQEINRCLMMVRIAATRRTAATQKPASRPVAGRDRRYDDYQEKFKDVRIESGEQLTLILATPLNVRLPKAQ